ncbi:MAG: hypothetical protein AAFY41_01070 [Bacteroidota bacterium]
MDNLSTNEKIIAQTLIDVDSLLAVDNGKFWGKNLFGPLIFINQETRVFYSNENDETNSFYDLGGIYKDTLPYEINIANTVVNWKNKRWSMVMLPLPEDRESRNSLVIHELFHNLQPDIGFERLQELNNGHLDTYDGRLLLKLELQALEESMNSTDNELKLMHIRNALSFRQKRQKSIEIRSAENSLELNEGLAEYTAIMLSGRNEDELRKHLIRSKNDFYSNPTFVRSFAYQTIPIYGYLLFQSEPNWHKNVGLNTNLTEYLIQAFEIDFYENESIEEIVMQNSYGYNKIQSEEIERENKRIEKISALKTKFIEQPTMELPFQNMNITFDPRDVTPIENLGTVYPNLRVTDDWGILTVKNGALLAANWSKVTVSEPLEISNRLAIGDGWQLELNPEWKVMKVDGIPKLIKK